MSRPDTRIVQLKLDDALIETGKRLRLVDEVDGHEVHMRFPVYGNWDDYVNGVVRLLTLIGQSTRNIELDYNSLSPHEFVLWTEIMTAVLKIKAVRAEIERIFYAHFRPVVIGLKYPPMPPYQPNPEDPYWGPDDHRDAFTAEYTKRWLSKRMGFDHIFAIMQDILLVDDWFKKKALQTLQVHWPEILAQTEIVWSQLPGQSSTATSPESSTAPWKSLEPIPVFTFDT